MKFYSLIFILFIFLLGCKKNQSPPDYFKIVDTLDLNKIIDTNSTNLRVTKEPVVIDTPSVVFFMPDYKERMKIIRFYGDYTRFDFEHIFRNFRILAYDARQALRQHHIKSYLSYAWQFKIKTDTGYVFFDRKQQNEILGIILADGHRQPLIKFGLYKYVEFERLVKQYFDISDFKMQPEPKSYSVNPYQTNGNP